jgi:hypothetical protein
MVGAMSLAPIPAPPLPEGGFPLVACDLGRSLNGQSGLGYPYGYGSDVCVERDPCIHTDGWLYLDYELGGDSGATTLYTIMPCVVAEPVGGTPVPIETVRGDEPVTSGPTALPETGAAETGIMLALAVLLVSVGETLRRFARP